MPFHQYSESVVNELARFCLCDVRQILPTNLTGLTTMPGVGAPGVRMHAEDRELLTIGKEFEFLFAAVRRG